MYSAPEVIMKLKILKTHVRGDNKIVIDDAIKCVRRLIYMVDKSIDICDNVGNKYIFHADRSLTEFDQGYNAGIRDALAILKGKDETT